MPESGFPLRAGSPLAIALGAEGVVGGKGEGTGGGATSDMRFSEGGCFETSVALGIGKGRKQARFSAPFPMMMAPVVHRQHLPRDLAAADLTLAYVHSLSPCQKTAGYDLHDPSRESCAWTHGRTVKHDSMNTVTEAIEE